MWEQSVCVCRVSVRESVSPLPLAPLALPSSRLGGPEVSQLLPRGAMVEAQDPWVVQTVG